MLNFIQSEFLKLKRSKLFLMVLLGMIAPAGFLYIGATFGNAGHFSIEGFLGYVNLYGLMLFDVIIFSLLASYLFVLEYTDHTLKSVLLTPISKNKFIIAKFLVFEIMIVLLALFNFAVSVGLGYLAGATDISLNILGDYLCKFLAGNILVSLVMTPFIFASLIFKNVIPTVIAGGIISLSNSMLYGQAYAPLSPFATPLLIVSNELGQYSYGTVTPVLILVLTIAIGLILSLIYFNKTDVYLWS